MLRLQLTFEDRIISVQMSLVFITNAILDLGYLRQVLSTH